MRFVVYDDATLEPITVVNIRGFTERDIENRGCRYRLSVPPDMMNPRRVHPGMPIMDIMQIVDLHFEPLMRARKTGEVQHSWLCFTKQEELALLLIPDWLPGQRGAVEHIQKHNEELNELLLKLIMESDR